MKLFTVASLILFGLFGCGAPAETPSSTMSTEPGRPAHEILQGNLSSRKIADTDDGFVMTANSRCPIMTRVRLSPRTPVERTVMFDGKTIGLCCDDCRQAWDSMEDGERRAAALKVLTGK